LPSSFRLQVPATHFSSDAPENPEQETPALGPYVLSGGWWGSDVHRDYYFVHRNGNLRWVYFDHQQQRFFLQGQVE
jgi:hypothetical protein